MDQILKTIGLLRSALYNESPDQDAIKSYEKKLSKVIGKIYELKEFYELPIPTFLSIINDADFADLSNPVDVLSAIIRNYVNYRHENSGILLNFIHITGCIFTTTQLISILKNFTNCELCQALADSYQEEIKLPERDFEYELNQKEEQIKNLKASGGFTPLTEKPKDFEQDIFMATDQGKLTSVQYLIETKGVDPESKDIFGRTPLHIACESSNNFNIIFYLLNFRKVSHDARDNKGNTPLHVACSCGELPIVTYLIEKHGALVETEDNEGRTPLYLASNGGFLNIVKYLIEEAHANINQQNSKGWTPLHAACSNGHFSIVEYLVQKKKANISIINNNKETAFNIAFKENYLEIVKFLLKYSTIATEDKEKLLFMAVENNDIALIKDLVETHGINYECYNSKQETPIDIAFQKGNNEVIEYLIDVFPAWTSNLDRILDNLFKQENNSAIDLIIDKTKLLIEHIAFILSYSCDKYLLSITKHIFQKLENFDEIQIISEWLCKNNFTSNIKYLFEIVPLNFNEKEQLLNIFIKKQYLTAANYLLSITETTETEKENLLFRACDSQNIPVVQYLIEKVNVNINAVDDNKNTALHHSVITQNTELVTYLLSQNAIQNCKNNDNKTPKQLLKLGNPLRKLFN